MKSGSVAILYRFLYLQSLIFSSAECINLVSKYFVAVHDPKYVQCRNSKGMLTNRTDPKKSSLINSYVFLLFSLINL